MTFVHAAMIEWRKGDTEVTDMQGVVYFLFSFFVASWVFVLGDQLGWQALDPETGYEVLRASLPIAYTGAIMSVGVLAVAVVAVLQR